MKFRIALYSLSANRYHFSSSCLSVKVTESELVELCKGLDVNPQYQPVYAKITYNHIMAGYGFTLYAQIVSTNPKTDLGTGNIWVPDDLIPDEVFVNPNSEVDVSVIDVSKLPIADSITIKLPSEKVAMWSDDEVKIAIRNYAQSAGIVHLTQKLLIKPETKDRVLASVESIYPSCNSVLELYRVDRNNTQINFEGLPANLQKVIDFSQIGGLNDAVNRIREITQLPLSYPEYIDRFGIDPPKGLLMFGPPGNGKSMIAKALAKSLGASFIEIDLTDALSKWVGGGEKKLKEKFKEAESRSNSIIFIDEIDSLAQIRSEKSDGHEVTLVGTLLTLMDGINSSNKIFVIGATNRPDAIDPALRRPGRFDLEIEIPLPNQAAREDILSKYIKLDKEFLFDESINEETIRQLAELTNGYSGADIKALYREAAMKSIREQLEIDSKTGKLNVKLSQDEIKIKIEHFLKTIEENVPSALRGLQVRKNFTLWDDILALDDQKQQLEIFHSQMQVVPSVTNLIARPSFSNILITGPNGAGKHTLVYAFARKYEYEVIEIDFIDLESNSLPDAYKHIDSRFLKCRQIKKAVLVLDNLDKVQDQKKYTHKVLNEISKIANNLQIFVFCICEEESLVDNLSGYKKFGCHLNLNLSEEIIRNAILNKFDLIEDLDLSNKGIGSIMVELSERHLFNEINY